MLAAIVSVAATGAYGMHRQLFTGSALPVVPHAQQPVPRIAPGSVMQLHSRFVGSRAVEIWGTTSAPDGSSIALRIKAGGTVTSKLAAPAAHGRFYAKASIPAALQGRAVRVQASVAP